jgi:hypothetical protein
LSRLLTSSLSRLLSSLGVWHSTDRTILHTAVQDSTIIRRCTRDSPLRMACAQNEIRSTRRHISAAQRRVDQISSRKHATPDSAGLGEHRNVVRVSMKE